MSDNYPIIWEAASTGKVQVNMNSKLKQLEGFRHRKRWFIIGQFDGILQITNLWKMLMLYDLFSQWWLIITDKIND